MEFSKIKFSDVSVELRQEIKAEAVKQGRRRDYIQYCIDRDETIDGFLAENIRYVLKIKESLPEKQELEERATRFKRFGKGLSLAHKFPKKKIQELKETYSWNEQETEKYAIERLKEMIVYHNFNPETEIEFDCIKGRKETRKIAEKELRRKGCQSKTKLKSC